MRQVIVDASGKNGRSVILNDRMKKAREIAGSCIELDAGQFTQRALRLLPARPRAASLWITATFLATTWASETQGFPEARHTRADARANTQLAIAAGNVDFGGTAGDHKLETVQASRFSDKPALVAQATTGDTEELQKALEQEQAALFERLLTLHKPPAESAQLNQMSESEYAELRKSLQRERERAERLEQDLAVARRDVETQTALAAKANDDATQLKQTAESGAAELKESLQQERERAGRLEQDLAAARRDVETQTALAARANDDATQLNKVAESGFAELKRSLQQEHDRAESLTKELSMARATIYAHEAQARKDSDQAMDLRQGDKSGTAELSESLQHERERAVQLEQDLAAARRDVETRTALAAKANDDATQLRKAVESGSAELKRSLQQEHDRAETLAQDLSTARTQIYAYEAQTRKAGEQAANLKRAAESGVAELRNSLQQERERATRLEQDLAAARRDVETQTALAAKVNEDATQLKQVVEKGSAELKRSLQKEHDRAEVLTRDLSMVHTTIYAYEAQSRSISDRAAGLKQAEESSATELRKSLVQEWERAARLQRELAAARRGVETQTALAAKARAEAARLRQVAEHGSTELKRSLQLERDGVTRLERELPSERNKQDAPAVTTSGQVTRDKKREAEATKPVAAGPATIAEARGEPQLTPENAAQAARLVVRASVLLGQGDISSARSMLERAADTGSAQASFKLAETYDPLILRKWGTYGTRGDAAKARDLYAKAQAGGIKEATERLDALRH
jgi:septal ring factor EnvC (AmiA/AmiB activator)